jgi:hypothetical protein
MRFRGDAHGARFWGGTVLLMRHNMDGEDSVVFTMGITRWLLLSCAYAEAHEVEHQPYPSYVICIRNGLHRPCILG